MPMYHELLAALDGFDGDTVLRVPPVCQGAHPAHTTVDVATLYSVPNL
jgi:hypothetical protein